MCVCVCLYLNTSLPRRPFTFFKFIYLPVRYSNGVRLLPNFQWLHCKQSRAAFVHVSIVSYRLHEKIYQHPHQGRTTTIKWEEKKSTTKTNHLKIAPIKSIYTINMYVWYSHAFILTFASDFKIYKQFPNSLSFPLSPKSSAKSQNQTISNDDRNKCGNRAKRKVWIERKLHG